MTAGIIKARTWQLLNLLADGEFHSGEVLANRLGVSRASVFNALAGVADYGVQLQRIRGRGYRLARPWQRLEKKEVVRWLGKDIEVSSISRYCRMPLPAIPCCCSAQAPLLQTGGRQAAAYWRWNCRLPVAEGWDGHGIPVWARR